MSKKKDLENFDKLMDDLLQMSDDLDERERHQKEKEHEAILSDLPEWQEYRRNSRINSKKANHNKEFFKKQADSETKADYRQKHRNERLAVHLQEDEAPEKRSLIKRFIDWISE
jgi:hypothetical protein